MAIPQCCHHDIIMTEIFFLTLGVIQATSKTDQGMYSNLITFLANVLRSAVQYAA